MALSRNLIVFGMSLLALVSAIEAQSCNQIIILPSTGSRVLFHSPLKKLSTKPCFTFLKAPGAKKIHLVCSLVSSKLYSCSKQDLTLYNHRSTTRFCGVGKIRQIVDSPYVYFGYFNNASKSNYYFCIATRT